MCATSVTPDFFYVFSLILSFFTCSQSFKNICTWELLGANVLELIGQKIKYKKSYRGIEQVREADNRKKKPFLF